MLGLVMHAEVSGDLGLEWVCLDPPMQSALLVVCFCGFLFRLPQGTALQGLGRAQYITYRSLVAFRRLLGFGLRGFLTCKLHMRSYRQSWRVSGLSFPQNY